MRALNFHLRACSVADSDLLSLVASGAFLEAFSGILDGADILAHCQKNNSPAAFANYLLNATTHAVIAEVQPGGAPIGYMLTCEPDLPAECMQPGDYELKRIYLLHRYYGTGVGRVLMQAAVEKAIELGRTRLLLGVYGKNDRAIAFYRKAGFETIGERYFTVGAATHYDLVMGKRL